MSLIRRTAARLAAMVAALAVVGVGVLASANPASAHSGNQSYLYLDISKNSVSGRIEAPVRDINEALGLSLLGTDVEVDEKLGVALPQLTEYFGKHLSIGVGGQNWPIEFVSAERFFSDLDEAEDNYAIIKFKADTGGAEVPRTLDIRFDPFFDEIPGRDALLLIGNDWEAGVVENGHDVYSQFGAGSRQQTINLGDTGWFKNFRAGVKLGGNHIKTGPDHVLFVIALLLPSVLVFRKVWQPTRSFGSSLWRVLKIVTMFTVAHTITFSLAGLELIPLPSPRIVEGVIAVSIAVAAIHNLRPVFSNREALIAFVFGLFHGLGFASLVQGLDVPRSTQMISLLGRNVGIEIGQALVVLVVFPMLFLLRRTRYYRGLFIGGSIFLTLVSIVWMIERVFEKELGINDWIDLDGKFRRAFGVMAILTIVAALIYRYERKRNRLLDVAPGDADEVNAVAVPATV